MPVTAGYSPPVTPARRFALMAGSLMAVRIAMRAFWISFLEEFHFYALGLRTLLFSAGLALVVFFFVQLKRRKLRPLHLLPAAGALVLYFFAMDRAEDFSRRHYFRAHKPAYEAAVQRWQGKSEEEILKGPREPGLQIEAGPPFRLGYHWPGSFLDDWCGAVYDPSKRMAPGTEKTYFGVYLVYCDALEGDWQYCCFT
jgi:hypothetical protein